VRDGVERVRGTLGVVDVLVSNAGIVDHIAPLTRMQRDRWAGIPRASRRDGGQDSWRSDAPSHESR
jgi:NAD(P)-dependent dehydrogenase (short-subunit alcohol dehydrogenase family)